MCLDFWTHKNNKFSIWDKWKIYDFWCPNTVLKHITVTLSWSWKWNGNMKYKYPKLNIFLLDNLSRLIWLDALYIVVENLNKLETQYSVL